MFKEAFKNISARFSRKDRIVCIGSSAKDIFFPTNEGNIIETPKDLLSQRKISFELGAKYQIEDRFETLGGCAANVSVGLARLGSDVSCYTMIGDDMIGSWIKKELERNGVKNDFIFIENGSKSDLSTIIVDSGSGERVIFFNRDANEKLEINEDILKRSDWIFVSALNGKWEDNLRKIVGVCKDNSIKLAFNPGQRNIKDNANLIVEVIRKSDVVMLNKDEAVEILLSSDLLFDNKKANDESYVIREISKICPGEVTLTDGQKGAWFISKGRVFHAPAMIVRAVDSTGAGDSFTSAFLAGYVKGFPTSECVKMGIVNSSSVVGFFGAIDGLLNERDIKDKIKKVKIEKVA